MTTSPAPLVPADCDLRDFKFTPVEFQRLFSSETWLLANDAEKVAAITLWGACWSQVPAGSIPANDLLLAKLSGAGSSSRWKRVRDIALRGWVLCADGRYYHPVMCEKALEAWMEKLSQRVSSRAGNASRWGSQCDLADIAKGYSEARAMLAALNKKARLLSKPIPPTLLKLLQDEASGNPKHPQMESLQHSLGIPPGLPTGIPAGSQGTGTGTGNNSVASSVVDSTDSDRSGGGGSGVDQGDPGDDPPALRYEPSVQVAAQLLRAGIPAALGSPEVLAEFRLYWAERLPRAGPGELDVKWFQRLQQLKVRGSGGDHGGGNSAVGKRGSAVERVRRAVGGGEPGGRVFEHGEALG